MSRPAAPASAAAAPPHPSAASAASRARRTASTRTPWQSWRWSAQCRRVLSLRRWGAGRTAQPASLPRPRCRRNTSYSLPPPCPAQAARALCAPEAVWVPWAHAAARLAIPFVPLPTPGEVAAAAEGGAKTGGGGGGGRLARMTADGNSTAAASSGERILQRGPGPAPAGVHPYFAGYGEEEEDRRGGEMTTTGLAWQPASSSSLPPSLLLLLAAAPLLLLAESDWEGLVQLLDPPMLWWPLGITQARGRARVGGGGAAEPPTLPVPAFRSTTRLRLLRGLRRAAPLLPAAAAATTRRARRGLTTCASTPPRRHVG